MERVDRSSYRRIGSGRLIVGSDRPDRSSDGSDRPDVSDRTDRSLDGSDGIGRSSDGTGRVGQSDHRTERVRQTDRRMGWIEKSVRGSTRISAFEHTQGTPMDAILPVKGKST